MRAWWQMERTDNGARRTRAVNLSWPTLSVPYVTTRLSRWLDATVRRPEGYCRTHSCQLSVWSDSETELGTHRSQLTAVRQSSLIIHCSASLRLSQLHLHAELKPKQESYLVDRLLVTTTAVFITSALRPPGINTAYLGAVKNFNRIAILIRRHQPNGAGSGKGICQRRCLAAS